MPGAQLPVPTQCSYIYMLVQFAAQHFGNVPLQQSACYRAQAMNSRSPPKEAFSQLPQLLIERNENDSDVEVKSPTSEIVNTPDAVRKAAATNVSRWQWKFWKKPPPPSPLQQQRQKQCKYSLRGAMLEPLSDSLSPGRKNANMSEDSNDLMNQIGDCQAASSWSPPRTPNAYVPSLMSSPLPPLEPQLLLRPRLHLDLNGPPTIAMEQLVRLQEYEDPDTPLNALQVAVFPKRCLAGDEIALMPCHSMQHRGFPQLAGEEWREPLRERDKHWVRDELNVLLHGLQQQQTSLRGMTRAPGANNRGKWARSESNRLHVHPRHTSGAFDKPVSPVNSTIRPQRVLLSTQGALISRSYCIVSIFGEGIYGRLYGAGLTGKHNQRCLHVEAYEQATSRTYRLRVTLEDIEWVFRVGGNDPGREALLAPGRKQDMLRQLIALLFFKYPDDSNEDTITYRKSNQEDSPEAILARRVDLPLLRLSPEIQLNEAALRRLEREERLRQEEARRLEELAALLAKPRRARHRVLCQPMRLRGRRFFVSVHYFPAQARNLVITAYNPSSSITFRLTVGLLEAASLVKLYPFPQKGFIPEQTLAVARGLLPRLRLYGHEDSRTNARMMLAIYEGRQGPGANALPVLQPVMTEERKREELAVKMQRDAQQSLQFDLSNLQRQLHDGTEVERVEIRQKIARLEGKRAEVVEKDTTLKTRIEEIDALGGGSGTGIDMKVLHEERRAHKTARQTLKSEIKSVAAQLTELNLRLQAVSEKEKSTGERAQRRAERARKRIREEVQRNVTDALRPMVLSRNKQPLGQRTWLSKMHVQLGQTLMASGGCQVSGKRVRFSLFVVKPEIAEDMDAVNTDGQVFRLELYDCATCMCSDALVVSKLEWLALTKCVHDQQLLVPELTPISSNVAKRLAELNERMVETRHSLNLMTSKPPGSSSKTKSSSNKKKREELQGTISASSREIYNLHRKSPWSVLVKALCERIIISSSPSPNASTFVVNLDRCIFRCVSSILCVKIDENESDEDEEDVSNAVYCRVRAEVLPLAKAVVFDVWDPFTGSRWRVEYPESRELLREFAVETFLEQQMHLEAIAMSLLLHTNAGTGQLELRFEE